MPEAQARILVAESNLEIVAALREQLERAGHRVEVAYSVEAAMNRLRVARPAAVLAGAAGFDGEGLCARLRKADPALPVALLSWVDDDALDWRAEAAGADLCLAGTLAGANLDATVRALLQIGALRRKVSELEARPPPAKPAAGVEPLRGASAGGFDFFRRLLLVEVHRSRRYKYPLAFLLASLDRWPEKAAAFTPKQQASFMGRVLRTVVKSVRDVDLCALYGNDRFVVFLPHTAPDGARLVSGRLLERIAEVKGELSGITASMGLACYDGQGSVSYGALLREATEALKKAQSAGGNRLETSYKPRPRNRVTMS